MSLIEKLDYDHAVLFVKDIIQKRKLHWRNLHWRERRYLISALLVFMAIWGLTSAYLALAPAKYQSEFSLILPGSGSGGSLNVESIGQAQSSSSSAFASASLSPTENYKRLLTTNRTLRNAAISIGENADQFPAPKIELIDQTNLIIVEIAGGSAEQAEKRATAVKDQFLLQLQALRKDEAEQREIADSQHLVELEKKVKDAQERLLKFQAENGLVSLDQFNNRIANLDALQEKEREERTKLRGKSAQTQRFSSILETGVGGANKALKLKSDPIFQGLAEKYASASVLTEEKSATLGDNHGELIVSKDERDNLRNAMLKRGREISGLNSRAILNTIDITVSDGRSNLMQGMAVAESERFGIGASLSEIRRDISKLSANRGELVLKASQLADLIRAHRVAEAVFSSALARLDTNKQDSFASYPLVQVLEAPSLPDGPSSPSKIIALAGAIAASIFLFIGLTLLWLRQRIIRKIFKKK